MKSPNCPETYSTERPTRSSSRPAAPRLSGFWRAIALAGALGVGAAAACGSESRSEIGENGRDVGPAVTRPDSGVEPARDAGGPVFPDAGTEADAGVLPDAGSADAGADAGVLPDASTADAGADAGAAPLPDFDEDGSPDEDDVCWQQRDVLDSNGRPLNSDGDALPNACDPCPLHAPAEGGDPSLDTDADGFGDDCDNAPTVFNPDQTDRDSDGVADIVDKSPYSDPSNTDADNDGYGAAGGYDCDDGNRTVNPGVRAETEGACSSVDRNCDGMGGLVRQNTDGSAVFAGEPECTCVPGATRPIGRNVGACVPGQETCMVVGESSGYVMTTVPEGSPNTPESCDGVDNNCSGEVDEGCGCTPPNSTRACGPAAVGECQPGIQTCIDGAWDSCEGAVLPQEVDLCNGEDEDCDGTTDNGAYGGAGGTPDQTKRGRGACGLDDSSTPGVDEGLGIIECDTPTTTKVSVNPGGSGDRSLTTDLCNGVDDDCDGRIDEEDYAGAGAKGLPCSLPGRCGDGVTVCLSDLATKCNADVRRGTLNPADLESAAGLCNGVDDDCEGTVDDGCTCDPGETQVCGTNEGLCNAGVQACDANGRFAGACGGPNYVGPGTEVCDGLDNDCDGITDEFANGRAGQPCRGQALSRCDVTGVLECDDVNGGSRCSVSPGGSASRAIAETCNGQDDDCDGVVDNGFGVGTNCPGTGECGAGVVECRADGTTVCSTNPGGSQNQATIEMCDQQDDDCDGSTDEGCRTCVPAATRDCGTDEGECTHGTQTCDANGAWGAACAGAVGSTTTPEFCNNLDDDCDGDTDEGTYGGIVGGTPGQTRRGRGACGLDNPATAGLDEGLGVIECNTPTTTRVSVNPGGSEDRSTRELCNTVDDDCDGVIDDEIPSIKDLTVKLTVREACVEPGICAQGLVECVPGSTLRARCDSISRAVTEVCNGLDDDCDGTTDEGFQINNVGIGGACTSPGPCGAGVVRCRNENSVECSSMANAVAEVAGDGVDNDCDGQTDE